MNQYRLKINDKSIKIYINDLIHLLIKKDEFIGIQSWIMEYKLIGFIQITPKYFIEYITKTRNILTEYDDIEKWKAILALLNDNINDL